MKTHMVISFSGGKTSAFMINYLLENHSDEYEFTFIFANTGQEHEKTLEFVYQCELYFGINLYWVEAVVDPREGVGIRHKIVNFRTAARNGEPFSAFIAKAGVPNMSYPQCSDRLKATVIESLKKELGLKGALSAIGMRADEPKRIKRDSNAVKKYNLTYPLAPVNGEGFDKQDVNTFWENMPFTLEIPEHHGNCKTCWKKSDAKLFAIAHEHPEWFDFNRKMEQAHSLHKLGGDMPRRVFFRRNRSTDELMREAMDQDPVTLKHIVKIKSDQDSGCSESCEAYTSED